VLAASPVLALASLLGGIIPEALVILTVVTLTVCILGCSLAPCLSVWAAKAHEVLMVVFSLWGVWLLSVPLRSVAASSRLTGPVPSWFTKLNPFVLAYAPYTLPGHVDLFDVIVFVAAAMAFSAASILTTAHRFLARRSLSENGDKLSKSGATAEDGPVSEEIMKSP